MYGRWTTLDVESSLGGKAKIMSQDEQGYNGICVEASSQLLTNRNRPES